MRNIVRLVPAVLVLALLSASPALPQVHRTAPPRSASLADTLRGFFADFTQLWGDLGCGIDPFGRCHSTPSFTRPATSLHAEEGCSVDPYGRCVH
jgi:hypothetical protein